MGYRVRVKKGSDLDGGISLSGLLVGLGMVALGIYMLVSAPPSLIIPAIFIIVLGGLFTCAGIFNIIDYYKNAGK